LILLEYPVDNTIIKYLIKHEFSVLCTRIFQRGSNIAIALKNGDNPVTLYNSGYNEWLTSGQDAILSFSMPDGGRVIVFSPTGSNVYDSAVDSGSVFVKQGSFVEMAGQPGNIFKVTAQFNQ
jgi:hypothetical protein